MHVVICYAKINIVMQIAATEHYNLHVKTVFWCQDSKVFHCLDSWLLFGDITLNINSCCDPTDVRTYSVCRSKGD